MNLTIAIGMIARTAGALAVALVIGIPTAGAQSSQSRPVRVAIPNQFPTSDARALVVRYASPDKGDVIILNAASLTPESFVAAVALLRHLRKAEPTPTQDIVATVKGFAPLGRGDTRLLQQLTAVLAQLRTQPLARIGNLGQGQWIELPDAALPS